MIHFDDADYAALTTMRVEAPERDRQGARRPPAAPALSTDGALFIVAADHTARGMIGVPGQPRAMADRRTMLERLLIALDNPRVDGVLASADILEDLVCLGALDGKVAVGTMNRGGLAGAAGRSTTASPPTTPTTSSPPTSTPARCCCASIPDRGTVPTLAACAAAVGALNDRRMMAMVEPIPYTKDATGRAVWDHDPDALLKAVGVCAGLGGSSAYTWLKIQATADIASGRRGDHAAAADPRRSPGPDPEATFAAWGAGARAADRARPGRRPGAALPTRRRRRGRRWTRPPTWWRRPSRVEVAVTSDAGTPWHPWHLGAVPR